VSTVKALLPEGHLVIAIYRPYRNSIVASSNWSLFGDLFSAKSWRQLLRNSSFPYKIVEDKCYKLIAAICTLKNHYCINTGQKSRSFAAASIKHGLKMK
jgi:hypothetical protein